MCTFVHNEEIMHQLPLLRDLTRQSAATVPPTEQNPLPVFSFFCLALLGLFTVLLLPHTSRKPYIFLPFERDYCYLFLVLCFLLLRPSPQTSTLIMNWVKELFRNIVKFFILLPPKQNSAYGPVDMKRAFASIPTVLSFPEVSTFLFC